MMSVGIRKRIQDSCIIKYQHRISFSTFKKDPTWSEHNRGNNKRFVDKARIRVTAGRGGNGCISFEMFSDSWRRPSGGHGGSGGNVILRADSKVNSLSLGVHHFNASPGTNGGSKNLRGRTGKDKIIRVPCGTVVKKIVRRGIDENDGYYPPNEVMGTEDDEGEDEYEYYDEVEGESELANELMKEVEQTSVSYDEGDDILDDDDTDDEGDDDDVNCDNEDYEMYDDEAFFEEDEEDEFDEFEVSDLVNHGDEYVAAVGGRPGLGNGMLASSKAKSSTLHHRSSGHFGDEAFLNLELKIIAQVGLVGYPNAGKSSFLGAVSNARPHVAPYPFTTMRPGLGIIEYSDFERISVADLPGLVDGAHENKGLGHSFLRHVERVQGIVYVIDAAGVDGRNPVDDLTQLLLELELYEPSLINKPALVFANKVDLPSAEGNLIELRKLVKSLQEDSALPMLEYEDLDEEAPSLSSARGIQGMIEMSMATGEGLEQAVISLRKHIVTMTETKK